MNKDKLLEKWLNDALTDAEMETFKARNDYELNLSIVENAKLFKASEISTVEEFHKFKADYNSKKTFSKKRTLLMPILKIAAVLVIAFGVYWVLFSNPMVTVETLAMEKTKVELPDHSVVTLNALSGIEYNKTNWISKREVRLSGEAYFKVSKGKTFNVITNQGIVTVVGTRFNVKQRDQYFSVKCFEGRVKVSSNGIEKILEKGDSYQISNGIYAKRKIASSQPSWLENKSNFEAVPLKEVFAELERQYNIEIIYNDVDTERLFTGGFVNDNLKNALISITKPMNLTFELRSSKIVIIHGKNQ
ncbi:FecR family protein [Gaetbulibacter aestuarii]|uniref:FecR family protein n=1 Tax=Gaetbulibacter aestuarii TaxID=1502358 RepID=A0ABW7MWD2_9FLAO